MGAWSYGPMDNDTALDIINFKKANTILVKQLMNKLNENPSYQHEAFLGAALVVASNSKAKCARLYRNEMTENFFKDLKPMPELIPLAIKTMEKLIANGNVDGWKDYEKREYEYEYMLDVLKTQEGIIKAFI